MTTVTLITGCARIRVVVPSPGEQTERTIPLEVST